MTNRPPSDQEKRIDCTKCMFYYITWDPAAPKGCHYYNFKSQYFPSVVVYHSSGERCHGFRAKHSK